MSAVNLPRNDSVSVPVMALPGEDLLGAQPAIAAAASRPEEAMMEALARESAETPLGLLYRKYCTQPWDQHVSVADRVKSIINETVALWEETMHRELPLSIPSTLERLQTLQTEILEVNLCEIGKLWNRGCGCFGWFITPQKVTEWLNTDPESLQDRLTSAEFCQKVVLACTFLPPQVIERMQDSLWPALGERALFPHLKVGRLMAPKAGIFLQVIMGKKDVIERGSPGTLQRWLEETSGVHEQLRREWRERENELWDVEREECCSSECVVRECCSDRVVYRDKKWKEFRRQEQQTHDRYEDVIKLLVDGAKSTPRVAVENAFFTFIKLCPSQPSHFRSLVERVSDDALNQAIESWPRPCLELLQLGGDRISGPVLDKACVAIASNREENFSSLSPYLSRVSSQTLDRLLELAVDSKFPENIGTILLHISRISQKGLNAACLEIKRHFAGFGKERLQLFLPHLSKMSDETLGQLLLLWEDLEGSIERVLIFIERIPRNSLDDACLSIIKGINNPRDKAEYLKERTRNIACHSLGYFLPHVDKLSSRALGPLLKVAIEETLQGWIDPIFLRIKEVSDEDFQEAFPVMVRRAPQLFAQFWAYSQRLGGSALGEALCIACSTYSRKVLYQILSMREKIPDNWYMKAFIRVIIEEQYWRVREGSVVNRFLPRVAQISCDTVLGALSEGDRSGRSCDEQTRYLVLKFLKEHTSNYYLDLEFEKAERAWQEEQERQLEFEREVAREKKRIDLEHGWIE